MSTNSDVKWRYLIRGKEYGPVSESDLRLLLDKRKIFRTTKINNSNMKDWEELGNVEEFKDLPPLPPVSNTYAWLGAILTPLTGIFGLIFCVIDWKMLRKKGYSKDYQQLWLFICVPAYLYRRSTQLSQGKSYFWINIILFALILIAAISNDKNTIAESETNNIDNGQTVEYSSNSKDVVVYGYKLNSKFEADKNFTHYREYDDSIAYFSAMRDYVIFTDKNGVIKFIMITNTDLDVFDAVIANPPQVVKSILEGSSKFEFEYYDAKTFANYNNGDINISFNLVTDTLFPSVVTSASDIAFTNKVGVTNFTTRLLLLLEH